MRRVITSIILGIAVLSFGNTRSATTSSIVFFSPQEIILAMPPNCHPHPDGIWTDVIRNRANDWLIRNVMEHMVQWTVQVRSTTIFQGPTKMLIATEVVWSSPGHPETKHHPLHLLGQDWDPGKIQAFFDEDRWGRRMADVRRQTHNRPGDVLTIRGTLREFLVEQTEPPGKSSHCPVAHLDIRLSNCQIIRP